MFWVIYEILRGIGELVKIRSGVVLFFEALKIETDVFNRKLCRTAY